MIIVKNLIKTFKSNIALNNISFSFENSGTVGLIGPNGAGKTTLMRVIMGIINPTSGKIIINGHDISQGFSYKKEIGYMPENSALYDEMTVISYLKFIASARKIPKKEINRAISNAAEKAQLNDVIKQKTATLSKGYKRRVLFAGSIIHNPSILILDEPTEGLDPNQKKEFYNIINNFKKDKLVIISTHVLDEIDHCSNIMLINNGDIIINSKKEELDIRPNEKLSDLFYRLTKGNK